MRSKSKKVKVAIITNIPTPYRKKQWEYYYLNSSHLDLTVFYCSKIEEDRYWEVESSAGIKEVFLKGLSLNYLHFNPGVLKILFQDFDIFFVGGYGFPTVFISIMVLRCLKRPWVMMIDGTSPLNLKKGRLIIDKLKKFLISGASAYFANGKVTSKLLQKYGINSKKIFNQFMTVDVDYFMIKGKNAIDIRNEIRQKYGITENSFVILYAGRLIQHKGVQTLIDAIKSLENKNVNVKSFIVGEGNFKEELKKQSMDINSDVIFTGHINPKDLYKFYYASDVFVLPTYDDPWGLVINEAMACGLPIIVTDAAGCSLDLVNENGIIVKKGDINELTSALEYLTEKNIRNIYGKNSLKIIKKWRFANSLDEFIKVINYCLK